MRKVKRSPVNYRPKASFAHWRATAIALRALSFTYPRGNWWIGGWKDLYFQDLL